MRILRWFMIAGLAVIALMVTGTALVLHGHATGWIVTKRSVTTWVEALEPHVSVMRPEGTGPFPVVAIFSGCGGVREHHTSWAQVAAEEGFIGAVVDGFAARNISRQRALREICSGSRLWGRERAGDVVAALNLIENIPDADPSRVVLFGQSHGAWTIMDLMAMDLERKGPTGLRPPASSTVRDGVIGTILFYPYCGAFSLTGAEGWTHQPATLMFIPQKDRVVSALACQQAAEWLEASGMIIKAELFPDGDHAFDQTKFEPGFEFDYRPDLTAQAIDETRLFLRALKTGLPWPLDELEAPA